MKEGPLTVYDRARGIRDVIRAIQRRYPQLAPSCRDAEQPAWDARSALDAAERVLSEVIAMEVAS